MKHTTKLSIVIPAYNEEGNITTTVNGVRSVLVREQIPYEIVLVDDNSTDATGAAMESLAAADPCIRIKRRKPPRGFGRAVRCGLESVTGDVVVICMADLSDDPEDIVKYYNKIEEGYDCVFGSRFIRGSRCVNYPRLKLFYNRIVNKVMQLLFWTRFNDLTNSFKSYRIHVIRDIMPLKACHFNITIELSLNALIRNYAIAQVPISWQGRSWGSSNLRISEMGRRYLSTLLRAWFEKELILDDLMAESVVSRSLSRERSACSEARLNNLETRVAKLEQASGQTAST